MTSWRNPLIGIAESAVLRSLEPNEIRFKPEHETDVPRVRGALRRAMKGQLARFGEPVNRNGFLCGCLDYTEFRPEEHLIVGYGFRYGSTTKIESVHHIRGGAHDVAIPPSVAHALWDHYGQDERNEVLLVHNHPLNLINDLLDNLPLPSQSDRQVVEARALQPVSLLRRLLGHGRVIFFLQENGFVKEFNLPSVMAILERMMPSVSP